MITDDGATPSAARISSCSGPIVPSSVWVVIGTPVAWCARAAARSTTSSYGVTRPAPVATLMTPARTPVSPMPSVISRTKTSVISASASPNCCRNLK